MAIMSVKLRRVSMSTAHPRTHRLLITADTDRNFFAVQFHPEVHHTPNGKETL